VQTKAERRENDAVQSCHWTISLLRRGVGRIAARVIEKLVVHLPRTMRQIIDETKRCKWFASNDSLT
jgi:hypothetical protein